VHKEVTRLIKALQEKDLTLALAESITCGLAANGLSNATGTSEAFKGGVVCYTPEVKHSLLNVSEKLIDKYTCESPEVTAALAKNLSSVIKADVYGALTGLASPGGSESKEKPVGTVFLAVRYKNKLHHERKLFRGAPSEIKKKACIALYNLIVRIV
jgi:nicotinamide-nucleotide amidase